jgi:cbb3-type cytochrome oxidase subunit 3
VGALGWALLLLLVVALAGGWLLWRSRKRSAWDTEATALEQDTRTATGIQLPPVLTAEDAAQRALSWPPLRAGLVDLENQALATGRDWRLLRPRVDQAEQALSAVLAGVPQQEPSAGGEPWQPPPGG